MSHRNRVLGIKSLTAPGNLFTLVFILLALGYGIFMTRGFTPSLNEVNPEQSQYKEIVPQGPGTAQNRIQLNKFEAGALPVNADCGYPTITSTPKPDMIYAINPEPNTVINSTGEIKVWYNDKLPMMIGQDSGTGLLTPFPVSPPEHLTNPLFGDNLIQINEYTPRIDPRTGITFYSLPFLQPTRTTFEPKDPNNFPFFPAIFVTDITESSGNRIGDAQSFVKPIPYPNIPFVSYSPPHPIPFPFPNKPVEINGTWGKAGDTVVRNGINVGQPFSNGTNIEPPFTEEFPVVSNFRMPGSDFENRTMEYSTELKWKANLLEYSNGTAVRQIGLIPTHTYRLQIIIRNITGVEIAQGCTTYKAQ